MKKQEIPESASDVLGIHGVGIDRKIRRPKYKRKIYDSSNKEPYKRVVRKIGRNEPCPCSSGKKYKKCCLLKLENQDG